MAILITPDNPAVTVASVTNPDLRAAFLEAHDLYLADPSLKGFVLHRPDAERLAPRGDDFDWMRHPARLLDMEQFSYQNDQIRGHQGGVLATPDYIAIAGAEHQRDRYGLLGFDSDSKMTVSVDDLDEARKARMGQLTQLFDFVQGWIHFETANCFRPHLDGSGSTSLAYMDNDRLFGGRRVRYLEMRNGPGTLIMDTPDSYEVETNYGFTRITGGDESRARQVREGDILVFLDDLWGQERSLPHASPDFQFTGEYRMIDNLDLGAGKPVAALRANLG